MRTASEWSGEYKDDNSTSHTPSEYHYSQSDNYQRSVGERASQLSNPPPLERERQVEEIKNSLPVNHEEKQVIESGINLQNADYNELHAYAVSKGIRIPAGKNKQQIIYNIENNVMKGRKGNFGPRK